MKPIQTFGVAWLFYAKKKKQYKAGSFCSFAAVYIIDVIFEMKYVHFIANSINVNTF